MKTTLDRLDKIGDQYKLRRTSQAIIDAYDQKESGLVIGHCKSLLESFSKTILDENNVEYQADEKFEKLCKLAVSNIYPNNSPSFEDEISKKAFKSIQNMVGGMVKILNNFFQALAQLRNDYCPYAHGRSANQQDIPLQMAEFVMYQTDALVNYLLQLLEERKIFYFQRLDINEERCREFNEHLCDTYEPIEIHGNIYQPHEILFYVAYSAYEEAFRDYQDNNDEQ